MPEKNDIYFWLGTDGHENVYMQKEKGLNSHISLILGKEMDIIKDEIKLPYRYKMCVVENQTPKTYNFIHPGNCATRMARAQTLGASVATNNSI